MTEQTKLLSCPFCGYQLPCDEGVCDLYREKYSDNRMIAAERKANRAFNLLMRQWRVM